MSMFENWSESLKKLTVMVSGATFFLVIIAFTSCTAIITDGPEEIKARAEIERAKGEATGKLAEAIERLVAEHNINPIAARCALMGWNNDKEKKACTTLAKDGLLVPQLKK